MAKNKEQKIAFDYYTKQGLTAKDISKIIGVTEKTIGRWAEVGAWKEVRIAEMGSAENTYKNLKELIGSLTEQRLELIKEINEAKKLGETAKVTMLLRQAAALSQEVAIQNKAIEKTEKERRITLTVYLEVMQDIFRNLERFDKSIYMQTLDFQDQHLEYITLNFR